MAQYERRMDALRQGEYLPPAEDTYDPAADMLALSGAHKKKVHERESYMSREQLEELRKVQNERVQVRSAHCLSSLFSIWLPGWQDEITGYGCETEYGYSHGWDGFR